MGPEPDRSPLPADADDVGLMLAYQAGDAAAFDQLFRVLYAPIRGYLASLSLDRGRAEDLAQETFLQLHRSRHTYRAPRPVRPWAFGIARYVFLADRRRARRRPETLLDAPDLESLLGGWAPDYAERRQLGEVLSRLRPDQREILVLRFAWGLSHEDLAAVLAIRPGAAKVRVHRALRQAQALLDDPKAGAAAGRLH